MVNVHALIATGVNADGHREILGLDVASAEDGAGWLAFWRGLLARGLSGVQLVIADAHPGLVAAIGSVLPGAAWQRCHTHYLPNLLTKISNNAQPHVATQVRTIFDQADAQAVHTQFDRVVAALAEKYPDAAEHLDAARDQLLALTAYPREIWRQIWSNNPQQRLNKENRRRTDVVGIFPGRPALIRLVGAVLAEQSDEWTPRPPLHEPRTTHQKQNPDCPCPAQPKPHRTDHDNRNTDRLKYRKNHTEPSHTPAPRTWHQYVIRKPRA